jgi:ATPase subunit of ABC transporter with duplicated ATPase domains
VSLLAAERTRTSVSCQRDDCLPPICSACWLDVVLAQAQCLGHRFTSVDRRQGGLNIPPSKLIFPPFQQDVQQWISTRQQHPRALLSGKSAFMSASITLSHLAWSTPEGRPLFSNLDLSFDAGRTGLVGRNGVGKTTLLKLAAGDLQPQSGTVSVNGTVGVLRQVVQADPAETIADLFGVNEALALLRRAESGEAGVEELALADWTLEARIAAALGRLRLESSPEIPLARLSGGQRTRAGLAALLFADPDFILLDEPTNDLDRDGRQAVIELLGAWRKGALVVSHDRELLETMDAIVELTSLGATRYGGNWSHYRERRAMELAAARHTISPTRRNAWRKQPNAPRRRSSARRARTAPARRGARGATSPGFS